MSRSRKRFPVIANTRATSEKRDKQRASRAVRRVTAALLKGLNPEDHIEFYSPRTYQVNGQGNWFFAKDGKQWFGVKALVPHDHSPPYAFRQLNPPTGFVVTLARKKAYRK